MAVAPGAQGCAAPSLATHGPTPATQEGVSHSSGGRGGSRWEVLFFGCLYGFFVTFQHSEALSREEGRP